jgi:O-methyltransferase
MLSISKKIVKRLFGALGYTINKGSIEGEYERMHKIFHDYSKYRAVFEKCKPFTMTSIERMYALRKAVEYIVNSKLPGDIVECGVWKGGSAMLIAYTLLQMGESTRRIYLYDTFCGMVEPTKNDYLLSDGTTARSQMRKRGKKTFANWCFSPLSEVRDNLFSTGYPENKLIFVKGKVEQSIPRTMPSRIALLRLDTDWYESTKHELVHLFPLLAEKGVLLIDDYGYWAGQTKAVEEYLATNKITILLNRIDSGGRIGIKI